MKTRLHRELSPERDINPYMTHEEYLKKLFDMLTDEELKNFNMRLYYEPEHVALYIAYTMGEFEKCLEYVKEHRNCLTEGQESPSGQ